MLAVADDLPADISAERVPAAPVRSATGFHAHVAPYWNAAVHLAGCRKVGGRVCPTYFSSIEVGSREAFEIFHAASRFRLDKV